MRDPNIYFVGAPPCDDLIGRRYIDPIDSGNLVMVVAAIDADSPSTIAWVHPVDYPDWPWWSHAAILRPLIAAYEAQNPRVASAAPVL